MDWDRVLADLENRFAAERRADLLAQGAELAEAETASVCLLDRLRAAVGRPVHLVTRSGEHVDGVLAHARPEALLLDEAGVRALVPVRAVVVAWPLPGPAAPAAPAQSRAGLRALLRETARAGGTVRVTLTGGEVVGRLVRVAQDHLDVLAEGGASGVGASGARVSVALDAVDVVRSR